MEEITLQNVPGPEAVRSALRAYLEGIPAAVKSRVRKVILYGSAARNEMRPDSDLDIYVVWVGREADAYDLLSPLAVRILRKTGLLVSLTAVSVERHDAMARAPTFFVEDVQRDGIVVAA